MVAEQYDFVTNLEISHGPEPDSHLNTNWISLHRNVFDQTCQNCHTTDDPGGTSNTSFCSNSACHGNVFEHAGFNAPALREVLLAQLPDVVASTPKPTEPPDPELETSPTKAPESSEDEKTESEEMQPLPTPEPTPGVTYTDTFGPLFEQNCGACHGENAMLGLDLTTYESTMQGGENGPVIIIGDSTGSLLIVLINGAQETIHIASFEFNLDPVAEALIAAHERGVEVQWVTDDEHGIDADEDEGHGQFAMMEEAGIEIIDDGRGALMHNKFWIFDRHLVWTGSTNISKNGNFRNNNVILIESSRVAEMFEREFTEMFVDGQFGPRSQSDLENQTTTINGTPVEVLFAAEDEVMDRLIPLIKGADKSIYFMVFPFTHDELGATVVEQAEAGIEVQGIFEKRASETKYSELPKMYCKEVAVRQDGNKGTFHHKVFIIDKEIVVTGSFNFSDNANESNDENVVIIRNADIAGLYLDEFDRRWAEARVPEETKINCKRIDK